MCIDNLSYGAPTEYHNSVYLGLFRCLGPLAYSWNRRLNGRCGNIMSAMFATAVINMFEDLAVIILPLPVLWNLHMRNAKKLELSGILAVWVL